MALLPDVPGYRLLEKLGSGGMSQVWLAEQLSVGREVALKLFDAENAVDPGFAKRFVQEGRLCARLNHPNIVTVHDVGSTDRWSYIAMEHLPGGSLQIPESGFVAEQVIALMLPIAKALEYAHAHSVVHRDIKPDNILFRDAFTPVVTDFGIAKALDNGTSLTQAGTIVGTALYMSPEQARGRPVDARTDLYSLGVVLFEMLVGRPPFAGDDPLLVGIQHITQRVPQLPEGMERFQELINRLLAKEPKDRIQNATELVALLQKQLREQEEAAADQRSKAGKAEREVREMQAAEQKLRDDARRLELERLATEAAERERLANLRHEAERAAETAAANRRQAEIEQQAAEREARARVEAQRESERREEEIRVAARIETEARRKAEHEALLAKEAVERELRARIEAERQAAQREAELREQAAREQATRELALRQAAEREAQLRAALEKEIAAREAAVRAEAEKQAIEREAALRAQLAQEVAARDRASRTLIDVRPVAEETAAHAEPEPLPPPPQQQEPRKVADAPVRERRPPRESPRALPEPGRRAGPPTEKAHDIVDLFAGRQEEAERQRAADRLKARKPWRSATYAAIGLGLVVAAGVGLHRYRQATEASMAAAQIRVALAEKSRDTTALHRLATDLRSALDRWPDQDTVLRTRNDALQEMGLAARAHLAANRAAEFNAILGAMRVVDAQAAEVAALKEEATGARALRDLENKLRSAIALQSLTGGGDSIEGVLRYANDLAFSKPALDALLQQATDGLAKLAAEPSGLAAFELMRRVAPGDPRLKAIQAKRNDFLNDRRFKAAVQQAISDAQALQAAGRLKGKSGAIAAWNAVLAMDSANATATGALRAISDGWMSQARQAMREREPERALQSIDDLERLAPAYPGLGTLREDARRLVAEIEQAQRAPAADSPEAARLAQYLAQARTAFEEGDLVWPPAESAYDLWKSALRIAPKNPEALAGLQSLPAALQRIFSSFVADGELKRAADVLLAMEGIGMAPLQVRAMKEDLVLAYTAAIRATGDPAGATAQKLIKQAKEFASDDPRIQAFD